MTQQALPQQIYDDKNGLTYILNGDYYIPLIEAPQDDRPIGKYGRMRLEYLKEHRPVFYNNLICTSKLHDHLVEVNECCVNMKLRLVAETAQRQGVTEALKASDQLRWVGIMNNIDSSVEEFILSEYVYNR
ncbi:MAG: TnpV protein [Clostridia bacterium]|nr:TnpV protein [Clostridia bacterium]